jgi:hypothetical protein
MRQNRRNRCDEILALIDRCLVEYAPRRRRTMTTADITAARRPKRSRTVPATELAALATD